MRSRHEPATQYVHHLPWHEMCTGSTMHRSARICPAAGKQVAGEALARSAAGAPVELWGRSNVVSTCTWRLLGTQGAGLRLPAQSRTRSIGRVEGEMPVVP